MELHNRKARHNYNILETYEAGIKLTGQNVKQLVSNSLDISSSYCMIEKGEIFIYNIPFSDNTKKKLLMHKKEILKLSIKSSEGYLQIIPLMVYEKNNKLKVLISLAKPKKNYDKRETIKKREVERDLRSRLS